MTWQIWALKWFLDAIVILSMFSNFASWDLLTRAARGVLGSFALMFLVLQGFVTFRLLEIRPEPLEFLVWFLMVGVFVMMLREAVLLGRLIED